MTTRSKLAATAVVAALLSGALIRCIDEPDYQGRACNADAPCPAGYTCTEQLICDRLGGRSGECSDASDCTEPGPCDLLDGRVACIDGRCRYAAKVCDDPPPGECIDGDTRYKSYSGIGSCDPSDGSCVYAEAVVDCLDCGASCLLRCQGLTCTDDGGGCRTEGHCVPEETPFCAYVFQPDATPCGDGYCRAGECVACTEDVHCDDANDCTEDVCDAEGACTYTSLSGITCDDGNACTLVDSCDDGICLGSDDVQCNDSPGQCYEPAGTCDPADGVCVFEPKVAMSSCDDANACTTIDSCLDGDCIGTAPLDCDDDNVCTDDACDPGVGCLHIDNELNCDDDNACTAGDTCGGGSCQAGTAIDCNDGNPCTADGCDPASGCTHTPLEDGMPCTFMGGTTGSCSQGACVGCTEAAHCNDNNPCTTDACVAGACSYTNNTNSCNDGNACTYADQCSNGTCSGTTVTCNSTPCITRSCNGTATCNQTIHNGRACPDDGNACTTDVCNASGTCTHPRRANGASCGANSANRCCEGSCVNISTNRTHCGGCNSSCASGLACESVSVTTSCSPAPANTTGRCRCNGSNAQCPRGQVCRTVNPAANRCAPSNVSNCAAGQVFVDVVSCPNYCRY